MIIITIKIMMKIIIIIIKKNNNFLIRGWYVGIVDSSYAVHSGSGTVFLPLFNGFL